MVYFSLVRTWEPGGIGAEACILCDQPLVTQSVMVLCPDPYGEVCPTCTEYFGRRNPKRFPTIEEFQRALQLFPEPLDCSGEEYFPDDPPLDIEREQLR